MNKLIKIIILVLFIVSISASVLYYFDFLPFIQKTKFGTTRNNFKKTSSAVTPTEKPFLSCLILDEQYCNQGKPIYDSRNQLVGLGFKLPEGSKIYAPFKGFYGGSEETLVEINDKHYPTLDLMDISRDDWARQDTQTYFFVIGSHKLAIKAGELAEKEKGELFALSSSLTVKNSLNESLGDYNLILTFRNVNTKTGEWTNNFNLLKEFFNYID